MIKRKLLLLLTTFFYIFSYSQEIKEVFSKDLFISEDLSGTIKLYENGFPTFTPFERQEIDSFFLSIKDSLMADTMKIFKEDWINSEVTPYEKVDLSKMKDSIIIIFRDSAFYCSPSGILSSAFGPRRGKQHKGIDTDLRVGDTIRATFDGKIRYSRYNKSGFGYLIIIRHFNGLETYYAHLSKLLLSENTLVKAGDVIGLGGKSGNARGSHLHYEVRYKDNAFDPQKIIDLKNKSLKNDTLILTQDDFKWIKQWRQRKYVKIKSGETLSHIAYRHGISIKKILKLNSSLNENSILQIGQKIRVR